MRRSAICVILLALLLGVVVPAKATTPQPPSMRFGVYPGNTFTFGKYAGITGTNSRPFDDDLERADHFVAREAACLGSDPPAMMLSHLAEQVTTLCVLRGDLEAAQHNAITSLEAIGTVGHRVCISHAIETASMVVLASGRPVDAAVLFEAASAIRHDFGSPPLWFECLLYDRARDGIDAAVSPAERALARERAAALVDDAAALELAMSTLRAG